MVTSSARSLLAAVADMAVMRLVSRGSLPSRMAAGESLSSARHTLWSDALSFWATEPFLGAGIGVFTLSSELASDTSSLAAVHSLRLQVGAELGASGVVLLALLLVRGLLFTAPGRPVALVAMAAWTALAVRTGIDHDFPIVSFMAGVVWEGAVFVIGGPLRLIEFNALMCHVCNTLTSTDSKRNLEVTSPTAKWYYSKELRVASIAGTIRSIRLSKVFLRLYFRVAQ